MSIKSLLRLACATAVVAAFSSTLATAEDKDKGELFSMSFEMESNNPEGPVVPLTVNFTLKRPAVLESYAVYCPGSAASGILITDGGPLGTSGGTVTGDSATTVFSNFGPHLSFGFQSAQSIASYTSPSHVGVPVTSTFSITVNPTTSAGLNCVGYAVLRNP